MSKLVFTHGVMGSAKSANLLIQNFELRKNGKKVLLMKPAIDTRDGVATIKSRIGISAEAVVVAPNESIIQKYKNGDELYDVIIVDEAQFLTKRQVDELKVLSVYRKVDVYAYGLKTDFSTNLFVGSKRLLELASEIREIEKDCAFCERKAEVNARFDANGKIVVKGDVVALGTDNYKAICFDCYNRLIKSSEEEVENE